MLLALDVSGSSISSFSVDVSSFPATYNTSETPTAVVCVSGGSPVTHTAKWTFSGNSATLNLSFNGSLTQLGYYLGSGTYNISLHTWGLVLSPP